MSLPPLSSPATNPSPTPSSSFSPPPFGSPNRFFSQRVRPLSIDTSPNSPLPPSEEKENPYGSVHPRDIQTPSPLPLALRTASGTPNQSAQRVQQMGQYLLGTSSFSITSPQASPTAAGSAQPSPRYASGHNSPLAPASGNTSPFSLTGNPAGSSSGNASPISNATTAVRNFGFGNTDALSMFPPPTRSGPTNPSPSGQPAKYLEAYFLVRHPGTNPPASNQGKAGDSNQTTPKGA